MVAAASMSLHANNTFDLVESNLNFAMRGCMNPNYPTISKKFTSGELSAKKIDIKSNGEIELIENVYIPFNGGRVKALSALYKSNEEDIHQVVEGNIYYLDSYFKFMSGTINKKSRSLKLNNGKTYLNARNLLIEYESLDGKLGSGLTFTNASLTSCNNIAKGWQINAETIAVDEISKRGYIKNLELQVRNKTIGKLPYLPFPATTQRLSGFLEPDLSITSDGLDLYLPYFLVLSKRSDITIAPRILNDRGQGIETNYRYLTHKNATNFLDVLFFPSDKEFQKKYLALDNQRWAFKLKDSRKFKNIMTKVEWAKSSDAMVLLDLPSNLTNIANQREHYLPQSIFITASFKNLLVNASREGYQTLNPFIGNGYIKKPQIELDYSIFNTKFSYFGKLQYSNFDLNSVFLNNPSEQSMPVTGTRLISELGAEINQSIGFVNIALNGSIISKKYDLNKVTSKISSKNIPSFRIGVSSLHKRYLSSGISFITAKLIYGKTEYKDQSLDPIFELHPRDSTNLNYLNHELFYGKDRIPDQEFLMGNLKWQARFKDQSKITFNLIKKNELQASRVINQMLSNILGRDSQLGVDIKWDKKGLAAFMSSNYSQKRNQLNFGKVGLTINLPATHIAISRNFRRHMPMLGMGNELNYAEISIDHNISGGYKLIGGMSKDIESKKNLESYFGIEFENCCLAFKVFASDKRLSKYNLVNFVSWNGPLSNWEDMISIENKSRINFEFELKGLTGSKRQLNKFFSNTFVNL